MKKHLLINLLFLFVIVSCDDIIEEVDITGESITILAPSNDVILTQGDITFSWQLVEDATTYHLQIATPTFDAASQITLDTLISKNNFVKTLEPEKYEFRVRAENSGYQTLYTIHNFSIEE